jgi:DNA-binding NtrC family response regulator
MVVGSNEEKPMESINTLPPASLTEPIQARSAATMRRLGKLRLRVCDGPDSGTTREFDLEEQPSIKGGRDPVNDLALTDLNVSGNHFELRRTEHGVLLRDLDSRNGVFVGDHRIREAWIAPGVVFTVGHTKVQLVATEDVEVPLAPSGNFEGLLGDSRVMRALFARVTKLAQLKNPRVLILGATGTGKELIARALHRRSARAGGPFIARECTNIQNELAGSTLFGHKRGAFTGAIADTLGCFEAANHGSLFLDEIGDLPLVLQAKLLRVLEEGEVTRVGEQRPRKVDVQVIFATHCDLRTMVCEKRFREDLWHRISTFKVEVPPLHKREDDVLLLADTFLARLNHEHATGHVLLEEARRRLELHTWPGNVRELHNVIEAAYWMTDSESIKADDLDLLVDGRSPRDATEWSFRPHSEALREFERTYYSQLMAHFGTKVQAARAAKISTEGLRQVRLRLGLP